MDAQSLAALTRTAASPPRLLTRNAAALEGAAVTLYVFRVPGRRDLCLTPSKPLGDVVTDLDVSTALYYVRFDAEPPAARMTLLRRNPATNSTEEVALVDEPTSHVDVFAVGYGLIEETFWRMNGNQVLTIKSHFGCTVHQGDSSTYFLSPWTGRCSFTSAKNGHALRHAKCTHTLQIPSENSVDISELRFNFSRQKGKSPRDLFGTSSDQRSFGSSSPFSQQSLHRTSVDSSAKRRSIFSRPSDQAAAGTLDENASKRRSFMLPLQRRLRSSSIDDNTALYGAQAPGPGQVQAKEFAPLSGTGESTLATVVEGHPSSSAFDTSGVGLLYAEHRPEESVSVAPELPPRPLIGPRPMVKTAVGSATVSERTEASPVSPVIPRRPVPSASEQSTLPSPTAEAADMAEGAALRQSSIKRKPVGSTSPVQARSPVEPITGAVAEPSIPEEQSTEPSRVAEDEGKIAGGVDSPVIDEAPPLLPPRPELPPSLPPRKPVGRVGIPESSDAVRAGFDHGLPASPAGQPSKMISGNEPPRSNPPAKDPSRLDLSLGQEKLGGGSDGEQAKLAKLIVYSEGQKMLDLIVAANVLMFGRAHEAANMP